MIEDIKTGLTTRQKQAILEAVTEETLAHNATPPELKGYSWLNGSIDRGELADMVYSKEITKDQLQNHIYKCDIYKGKLIKMRDKLYGLNNSATLDFHSPIEAAQVK